MHGRLYENRGREGLYGLHGAVCAGWGSMEMFVAVWGSMWLSVTVWEGGGEAVCAV